MDTTKFLGEQKISSLLWQFSLPAVVGMVVSTLYNVIDSIFVGRGVGEIALTAVAIAFPIMIILMAVGMLVGIGAATLVSLSLGEKNKEQAEMVLGNALTMMIIFILVTTGLALWYLEPILVNWLGVTPEVLPYARDFTAIILGGSMFMHIGFGLNNVIRAQGDPQTALATQLIAAVINIVLNYLLIFVFPLGIKGSAIATILAQASAAFWVVYYFMYGSRVLRFKKRCLALRMHIVKGIFKIGVAPFLMQLGASVVMVVLNLRIMEFGGIVAVASFGIINRVLMLIVMPVAGISQGVQPIIGYNYGAKQYQRVLTALNTAIAVAVCICLCGFLGVQLFAEQIVRLFNDGPQLVEVGTKGMRIFLLMVPVIGFQIIVANYFQAIGKAYYSIIFNLLRQVIVLIPLVFIFSHYFGLLGIWAAGPISDIAAALLTGICLYGNVKQLKCVIHKEPLIEYNVLIKQEKF
ncbi:putative MATE family efflux protein [Sporomusaceae bacterium BoRhaA]|uniref:MATE family efflux transporter n=1 Tax=Pelorhabdus rhamnosifermentans TaxID=2772457 RepID=UPI001C0615E3|nr:MATE family efflux transporter [Pelorhabdus rhamnosifermentans]MBU2699363.1 putative MATE family efflux protein [Pelorhabdus rhamnosifermentans]